MLMDEVEGSSSLGYASCDKVDLDPHQNPTP